MSRRFGRNQRRRAREAETALRGLLDDAHDALYWATERRERAERAEARSAALASGRQVILDGVREALGEQSILLDPLALKAEEKFRPIFEFTDLQRVAIIAPAKFVDEVEAIRVQTASVIDAFIEHDHYARRTHFKVAFRDMPVAAYAIDDRALREPRLRDRVRQVIAVELANSLVEQLGKGKLL